jgi:hypothetical protein
MFLRGRDAVLASIKMRSDREWRTRPLRVRQACHSFDWQMRDVMLASFRSSCCSVILDDIYFSRVANNNK